MVQLAFYFDQSRCSGCFTCVVACKDWHDTPAGSPSWIRILTIEKGQFPNVWVGFLPRFCYHCATPACLSACPSGAITKSKRNNIVVVDKETCFGLTDCGGACKIACPYDAPQFGTEQDAKMEKCDLCLERWEEGKKPVCVEACPMRALDAGPLEELESRYGEVGGAKRAEDFPCEEMCKPSIIFKAKNGWNPF